MPFPAASIRRVCLALLVAALPTVAIADSDGQQPAEKRAVASGDLLLPLYQVDTNDTSGLTTLYSLRNNSLETVQVEVLYYEADGPQAFQRRDTLFLTPKAIKTVDIRNVANLEIDADGFARGYVIFRTLTVNANDLQGDYFTITPGEAFASGLRLVNIDQESAFNELCGTSVIRFLRGGGFSGGTSFNIWFEAETTPIDPSTISYSVYDEVGNLIFGTTLPTDKSAFSVDIGTLLGPFDGVVNFGAIEFSFSGQVGDPARNRLGHVTATLDALGLYSVGLEATCSG